MANNPTLEGVLKPYPLPRRFRWRYDRHSTTHNKLYIEEVYFDKPEDARTASWHVVTSRLVSPTETHGLYSLAGAAKDAHAHFEHTQRFAGVVRFT